MIMQSVRKGGVCLLVACGFGRIFRADRARRLSLSGLLTTALVLSLGARSARATSSIETEPGSMPASFVRSSLDGGSGAAGGLSDQFFSASGGIYASVDAAGSNLGSASIRVNKRNATSTVRKAFLLATSTGFQGDTIADGILLLQGSGITFTTEVPSGIASQNYLADVTSIVKPVVDAAAPGLVDLTVNEGFAPATIDGEVLAVVFDDSSQTATHSIIMLFGAQAVSGDTFAVTLAEPIDPSSAGALARFGLGISYSFQTGGVQQYSIVNVNDQRLSTSAGGEDDCRDPSSSNGCLMTVGGIGDADANPANPNATPTNPRSDDELYTLLPFLTNTTSGISVFTQNPSNDDNVFFAYFELSAAAVVGEGIVLAPDSAANPVGTTHTVTATVVNTQGLPVVGRSVTFAVITGPNAGAGGSVATDFGGHAQFTYADLGGAGTDQIQASFVDSTSETVASNIVTKTWEAGCGDGVVDPSEDCDPAAMPTGCSDSFTCAGDCTCKCVEDSSCDDGNGCTADTCNDGDCVYDRAGEGEPCDEGVCLDGDCVLLPASPVGDLDVFTACRPLPPCVDGTVSCDIHVVNRGPTVVPEVTIEMDLTADLQAVLPLDPLKVFASSGGAIDMGPMPVVAGQHVKWTASNVPAGGKAATWFTLTVGAMGGTKTVAAGGSATDPDLTNNHRTETITPDPGLCPPEDFAQKAVVPSGPVCTSDSLFYVMAFQHPGAATADLLDVLDPCLDPSSVSALMPGVECTVGTASIACSEIALDGAGRGQVSFAAKPRLGCPPASIIVNQAQVVFDDGFQQLTNPTANVVMACEPCTDAAECDDGNECTADTCNVGARRCLHDRANEGRPCADEGVCLDGECALAPVGGSGDLDVLTACRPFPACPEGTVSCDVHVFNHGPSAVPEVTVDMELTGDLQAASPLDPLKVFAGFGGAIGMGPAPTVLGQHIEWTASNVPAGGKAATWFTLQVGALGGSKTVSAAGDITDPQLGNNDRVETIVPDAERCPAADFAQKAVSPTRAVCETTSLFYVMVFQHSGATVANLVDELDPCIDPTTVSGLMPEGQCIVGSSMITCTDVPLDALGRGQVSYAAKPRLGCQEGTGIVNQAHVTFDDHFELTTDATTNELVSCEQQLCSEDTDCDDGNSCNGAEVCAPQSGICARGPAPEPGVACTSDNFCEGVCNEAAQCVCKTPTPTPTSAPAAIPTPTPTRTPTGSTAPSPTATPAFRCGLVPATGCVAPAPQNHWTLLLRNSTDDRRDRLVWKWRDGGQGDVVQFGDPVHSTEYVLCMYAGSPQSLIMSAKAPSGGTCAGHPCWRSRGSRGFRYVDWDHTPDGISRLVLRGRSSIHRAQIVVKGVGVSLPVPILPLAQPLLVQLIKSEGLECWEAKYSSPAKENSSKLFRDKND